MLIPPLTFIPRLQHTIWGGKRLYALKNLPVELLPIGESWEISPLTDTPSVVESGDFAGFTLPQLMQKYAEDILGEALYHKYGKKFPLLVKFIDAGEDLSVQVHPGKTDSLSLSTKKPKAEKNEIWYIMDALPSAEIILGLSQDATPHELIQYAIEGKLFELVRRVQIAPGQLYDIPAGTVHAIRRGSMILEIQQPTDITYRLWDYDRVDNTTGRKRPLHLAEAVEAAILTRSQERNIPYRALPNGATQMLEKKFATIEMIWVSCQTLTFEPAFPESFAVLIGISGECTVADNHGNEIAISCGKVALFPATGMPLKLTSSVEGKMISVSLPDPNTER